MSGIGLDSGYVSPEKQAAASFNAAAQPTPSASGIGLTPSTIAAGSTPQSVVAPPTVVAPTIQPTPIQAADIPQPTLSPATTDAPKPAAAEPLIDFHKDPFGAIGLVLQSLAAGYNHTESPVDKLKAERVAQQAEQYKTASLGLDVIGKYEDILSKSAPADHPAIIQHAQDLFGNAVGGMDFKPILTAFSDGSVKNAKVKIQAAAQFLSPQTLALYANDPAGLDKLLTAVIEKREAAAPKKTPEEIFTEHKAAASGDREGNPPAPKEPKEVKHQFVNVDGQNQFLTDDQIIQYQANGKKVAPASTSAPQTMNNDQSNAATFADRAAEAEKVLGPKGQAQGTSVKGAVLSHIPGGNFAQSGDYQKYDQAKRDFVNAVLRKESGAAISDSEFANAEKQYFPQPGDQPDTIKQKTINRATAIKGISRAAGPNYKRQDDPLGIR